MLPKYCYAVFSLFFFPGFSAAAILLAHRGTNDTLFGVSKFISVNSTHLTTADKDSRRADVGNKIYGAATPATVERLAEPVFNVKSTALILARSTASAYSVFSGLNGYGIPYEVVIVPKTGFIMPNLSSSDSQGNYGAIFVVSDVSYDYGGELGFQVSSI